jgi:DNA-binding NarL/FixJ family response regulator
MTSHDISEDMHLGYKTVANYSTQVKNKLKASSTAELANIAMAAGITKPNL